MSTPDLRKLLIGTTMLTGWAGLMAAPAYAQTPEEDETVLEVVQDDEEDQFEEEGDTVVVTGSRLQRDTFSSTVPLQILSTEDSNEAGLFSPVEILQTNAAASGQQIDSTFQGFVLDNGPGSETINLRALGADRTLLLINGRRFAPAGVEGAPTNPSINLIPASMVDRFELLLDGASAVYGSDAVAGVVNVILRNDYDGLELDVFADTPEQGAGQDYFLGARYGKNFDRGFIGGAVEYSYQDPWFASDRDFLSNNGLGCETYREITENGEIRTEDLTDAFLDNLLGLNTETSPCRPTRLTQRIFVDDGNFGSVYFQPSINNTGFGFSESTLFSVPIDGNGDGLRDVNFFNFSPNGQQSEIQQIVNEQDQISFFANGEYNFEGEGNVTAYFEGLYTKRDIEAVSGQPQLFPFVPASNPFNPCNIANNDCAAAYNAILADPDFAARFGQFLYTDQNPFGTTNCFGLPQAACTPAAFGLFDTPGQSFDVQPIVGVKGDRNVTTVELEQLQFVTGLRGDLASLDVDWLRSWSYDASIQYSTATGKSNRTGVRGDRLDLAVGVDPNTGAFLPGGPCSNLSAYSADVSAGCVPVNMFAPSLYASAAGGDFATAAERAYLFDDRTFDTEVNQLVVSLITQGDLFDLPGGKAKMLVGAEYREDTIDSRPNAVASDGLLFGFFSDGGASGDVDNKEIFGEITLPLGTGKPGLRELNVDLAGRITDNEFYGTNETYSIKAGWRPIDSLLLRATYGTSFRAPNTRELFLAQQSGFNNSFTDLCGVPSAAIQQDLNGNTVYIPTNDPRSTIVLDNCRALGIDPTSFLGGNPVTSVEVFSGGVANGGVPGFESLDPETSKSFTLGGSFEQPFFDSFDFTVGVSYFNLKIEDAIFEVGPGTVQARCLTEAAGLASPFCGLIQRDPTTLELDSIQTPFLNLNRDDAEFIDYNFDFTVPDIALFERNWEVFGRGQFSQYLSRSSLLAAVDPNDPPEFNERVGDFGVPEWTGQATIGFEQDRWSFAWTTFYIGSASAPLEDERPTDPNANNRLLAVDGFTNPFDTTNTFNGAGTTVTCLGPQNNDVNCRTVFSADDYFRHNISMAYEADTWNIRVGVNNVFDKAPPLVSAREVFSVNNVPVGNGYDLNGREYFVRLRKTF